MTPLTRRQGRVVGSLIEKQLTTPQQYPLSANALLLACNQASNRDPVVAYTEAEVASALDELRDRRLVRFLLPSHGRTVVRYRHVLDEVLGLDVLQLALVGVLLLRGPQTVGELRGRIGRMADAGSLEAIERELALLAEHEPPLAARVPRQPGQKEDRWTELLQDGAPGSEPPGVDAATSEATTGFVARQAQLAWSPPASGPSAGGTPHLADPDGEVGRLRREVASLREEVGELRAALDELRSSLGG